MKNLSIDIETASSVKIADAGSYKYAQSEDFHILLFGYKVDAQPAQVIDLTAGEAIPDEIKTALTDADVVKHAFNAQFEWWCLNQAGYQTPIEQWECTMINAYYHGYPGSLKAVGDTIGLSEDKKKLDTGKALIRYFCQPCKPTKSNGGRTWNLPHHDPEKWELFKTYNRQDVESEYAILQKLNSMGKVPEQEWKMWHEDIKMNAHGVHIDRELVENAVKIGEEESAKLLIRAKEITGLPNPKSNAQLKPWLEEHAPMIEFPNVRKETLEEILENDGKDGVLLPDDVREMLELKPQLSKTSTKKYDKMLESIGSDDRIRGCLQFYGTHTGRWSGRLVQMQNLRRNSLSTLDEARNLTKSGNYEALRMIYGDVNDVLSQLVRTAITATPGGKLVVSDFSAIEARLLAWEAGEQWVSDVFAKGGDIYCETASKMFNVPVVKHGINGHLRQKGKIATLALGYSGSVGAMVKMGALKMGLKEEELPGIVRLWRMNNPHIVQYWYDTIRAVQEAVSLHSTEGYRLGPCIFRYENYGDQDFMTIELPSGRKLYYNKPNIIEGKFGPELSYMGQNQTTKKWTEIHASGGKLVENITQAIARDCLCVTLMRSIKAGWQPVMSIHDEIIMDAPMDAKLDDLNAIFAEPIDWAPGLILKGAGFENEYYMKD